MKLGLCLQVCFLQNNFEFCRSKFYNHHVNSYKKKRCLEFFFFFLEDEWGLELTYRFSGGRIDVLTILSFPFLNMIHTFISVLFCFVFNSVSVIFCGFQFIGLEYFSHIYHQEFLLFEMVFKILVLDFILLVYIDLVLCNLAKMTNIF